MLGQASTCPLARRSSPALGCALALLAMLTVAFAAAPAQAAKKGKKSPPVGLGTPESQVASGENVRLEGAVKKWARGQRVLLLAKPTGIKRWSRAGATTLRGSKRFSFTVKPPLGKTAYKAVAQRKGRGAPKAGSRPLRVLGLPGAAATLSVGAGGRVTIGGLLPTPVMRKVVLQRRAGGGWTAVGSKSSSGRGEVSFGVTVTASATYRLFAPRFTVGSKKSSKSKRGGKKGGKRLVRGRAAGSSLPTQTARSGKAGRGNRSKRMRVYPAFTSPPTSVRVEPDSQPGVGSVTQSATLSLPDDVCTGQEVEATMSFSPARSGWRFALQISEDGSWTTVASGGQGASGDASAKFPAPDLSGTYDYRVVAVDTGGAVTGTSASEEVEVRLCAAPPPLPQIYGGSTHSCEIDAFGVTWCWGEGRFGQLGDGTNEERTKPVEVSGGHEFVDLGLGTYHTCGIVASGKAYCWGSNGSAPTEGSWIGIYDRGALGDGTETNRSVPTPVAGGHRFVQITAGQGHTCGLATTGVAYCWGFNLQGAVGDGTLETRLVPTRVIGGGFEEIDAFGWSTCGLSGGRAFCWGDPTDNTPYTPKPEDGVPSAIGGSYPPLHDIETDYARDGCALSAAGAVYCWGGNSYGRLGRGPGASIDHDPAPVTGGHTFTDVAGGNNFACGLTDENSVLCWGYNNFGPLGRGTSGGLNSHPTPEPVAGGHSFTRVGVGYGHSCAVDTGRFAWCWGFNAQGQIGNGIADLLIPALQPNTVLFPGIEP